MEMSGNLMVVWKMSASFRREILSEKLSVVGTKSLFSSVVSTLQCTVHCIALVCTVIAVTCRYDTASVGYRITDGSSAKRKENVRYMYF